MQTASLQLERMTINQDVRMRGLDVRLTDLRSNDWQDGKDDRSGCKDIWLGWNFGLQTVIKKYSSGT